MSFIGGIAFGLGCMVFAMVVLVAIYGEPR
jgi:hypothetical protein